MKRVLFVLLLVVMLAAAATPAWAAPTGHERKGGDEYVCDDPVGSVVVFGGSGRSGWIGDTLYQATSWSFTGSFTPVGGDLMMISDSHTYGNGPSGSTTIHCTAHFEGSDETGTFVGDSEVWAVAVR